MNITECQFCGDACGEEICLSCQDTGADFGYDMDDLMEMFQIKNYLTMAEEIAIVLTLEGEEL